MNSGAKRCISSAVQSAGFLPLRTLSSTKRPHNLVRLVERRAGARQRFGQVGGHHPAFLRPRPPALRIQLAPIPTTARAISSEPAN